MIESVIYNHLNHHLNSGALDLFYSFYHRSGCKKITQLSFEKTKLGFSEQGIIYLNKLVFDLPIHYFLYVILHEIAHQFQYKKYGKDYVLDLYMHPDKYDKFWEVERVADRIAIKKTIEILKKDNKKSSVKLISIYNTETKKDYIKKYLKDLNTEINENGFKTIEEINNYLIQKNKEHVRM